MFQFLGVSLLFSESANGGESVLVTEASGHLIHLVSGFLGICLRQLGVDAVGGATFCSPSPLPPKVCMTKYISAQTGTKMTTGKIYFGCLKLILVIIVLFK